MKHLFIIILIILYAHYGKAQIYEIGPFVGGSNFIGDVGATTYINPNQLAYGGLVKWNRSPRHSYRLSIIHTNLESKDSKSHDPRRVERGYEFDNQILEISGGMEFTFWDFNLHYSKLQSTPYLYSGLSVARHKNSYFDSSGEFQTVDSKVWTYSLPMVLGFKTNYIRNFVLAVEIGARYTFSDNLDGSAPVGDNMETLVFGNPNSNDWYVFSGIILTYTFGRNDCYCRY